MLESELLQQLSTAVILFDKAGRFAYLNQAAEKAFSTSAKNLLYKRYNYFIDTQNLPIRELLGSLKDNRQFLQNDLVIKLKNHLSITINLSARWITIDQDYLMFEWQNLGNITRYQHELHIQQQNRFSNLLLQKLAHEIKNPLSGMRGAAQLLALEIGKPLQAYTEIIQHEVDRLSQLVDRMLFAHKKASKMSINIHEITEQVFRFCLLNLQSNITLTKDYDPSLPELFIAPESIYQALLNLLQNAIEACMDSSNAVITLKTRAISRHTIGTTQYPLVIKVDVTDNGPGIEESLQSNIFLPLISGKNSSGLGLGIAQSLIQQNQGIIEFSSEPGNTIFSIYLPLINEQDTLQ